MNVLRTITIEHLPTGHRFPWHVLAADPAEAVRLARLTFVNPKLWLVDAADAPPVHHIEPALGMVRQASLFD